MRVVRPAGRYKLHADEWMPSYQVSRRMKSPVVWYLLTSLLRVLHAGPQNPDPECSDGGVRLLTSFADSDDISDVLNGVLGDVRGISEVCENQLWKKVVLCVNGGGEQWTVENTAVACREHGYAAPGESGANNFQSIESSRRLSYIPQCIGSEERLRDCSSVDQDDSCDAPLVTSCWNSSSVTSIILLSSTAVPSVKLSSATTSTLNLYSVNPSTFYSSSSHFLETTSLQSQSALSSSPLPRPSSTASTSDMMTSSENCVHMFVYGGLVGGAVGAAVTGTLSIALYLICSKRNRQSNDTFPGEGDDLERNPAYKTAASLIPSSTNPSYAAGLNMTTNIQVYEDVSAL